MANITLTNLPTVTSLNGTEPLLGVQSNTSVQITTGQIVSLATGGGGVTPLPVIAGGTGDTTLTQYGLLYGNGTAPVTSLAPPAGTNYVLVGSAGSAPSWQATIPVTAGVDSISFGTTGLTPSTNTAGVITVAGTLVAANGGTGQSSYTIGDLLYASSSTALSKLADVATGSVLISGGVGAAPSYSSSPTLTTSLTTPLHIGGTAASSTLTLESTSGAGTSDSIIFKTGSQVTAMTIGTAQNVNIGTTAVSSVATLRINKNITGGTTAYNLLNQGTVQSDVTAIAYGNISQLNTAATSFTLASLLHFTAAQGTIGIGSQITTQYGFNANTTLIGATNNYGMYSNIPSVTTATISNVALTSNVVTITTSSAHSYGTGQSVIVAATTTTSVNGTFTITSVPSTTTFTYALVAADIASVADTGSTYVNTGRYNFYAAGTAPNLFQGGLTIAGGANTGGAALALGSPAALRVPAATYTDIVSSGTVSIAPISIFQGGVLAARNTVTYTTAATVYIQTAASAGTNVTITNPYSLYVAAGASYFGGALTAASTVTMSPANNSVTISPTGTGTVTINPATAGTLNNMAIGGTTAAAGTFTTLSGTTSTTSPLIIGGTTASSTLTLESTSGAGTSDSIIFQTGSQVTAMTIGTAQNVNIGTGAAVVGQTLRLTKTMTGATISYGITNLGTIQSDVTTTAYGYYSGLATQAASFTLPTLSNYQVVQGVIGLGSQITNQFGLNINASMVGATNNYGVYSNLPSVNTSTISNVAADGTTATITTSAAHGYGTGQSVIVAATTNTSLNGTFTITSVPSTTTFTYTIAVTIASTADTGSTYVNTGRYNFYAAAAAPNLFQGSLTVGNGANTGGVALSATSAAIFRSGSGTGTTYTDIVSSGTVGTAPISLFQNMALAARNTVTYTTAATLYITGAPTAGTNVTITNPYALYVAAGTSYFGGAITSTNGPTFYSGTAVPAGGTAGTGVKMSSTSNLGIFFGSGVPTLSAAQGSIYIRTDGSSISTRMYINTNGSTTWTNVVTAA